MSNDVLEFYKSFVCLNTADCIFENFKRFLIESISRGLLREPFYFLVPDGNKKVTHT